MSGFCLLYSGVLLAVAEIQITVFLADFSIETTSYMPPIWIWAEWDYGRFCWAYRKASRTFSADNSIVEIINYHSLETHNPHTGEAGAPVRETSGVVAAYYESDA